MNQKTPRYSVSRKGDKGANRYFVGPTTAVILCPAPKGLVFGVPIDRSDLERVLSAGFWRVSNSFPNGRFRLYAYTFRYENGERKRVYMHRFVTGAPQGTEVDHANHRGTDNRRSENLTVCTHRQNMKNQKRYRLIPNQQAGQP